MGKHIIILAIILHSLNYIYGVSYSCSKTPEVDDNGVATFTDINDKKVDSKLATSYDTKGLQPFFNLADSFMNTVQPKSVDKDILDDIKLGKYDKLIDYEMPVMITAGVGVLFLLVMTLTGLCFCCCRSCGKCGGTMVQSSVDVKRHKTCCFMSALLLIFSIMLLCGVLFMFVTNNRLHEAIKDGKTTFDNSIDTVKRFRNSLIYQLEQIFEEQIPCIVDLVTKDVSDNGIRNFFGVPLHEAVKNNVSRAIDLALAQSNNASTMFKLLTKVNATGVTVKNSAKELGKKLSDLQAKINNAHTKCKGGLIPDAECDKISAIRVGDAINLDSLPDVTGQMDKLDDLVKQNMTKRILEGKKVIDDIPNTVVSKSKSDRDTVNTTINDAQKKVKDFIQDIIGDVKNNVNNFTDNLSEVDDNLESNSDAMKYENMRWIVYVCLAAVVALIFFLMFLGLTLGVCSYNKERNPSQRTAASSCGGIMLMSSVGLMFIFFWLLMLFCVVWFVIGIHTHVVCRDIHNGQMIDTILGDKLLIKGEQIVFEDVLNACRDNKAIYAAVKAERFFDLSAEINITKQAGDITAEIDKIQVDFSDQVLLTPEINNSINELKNSGVDGIDFNDYFAKIEKEITTTDLTELSANISSLSDNVKAENLELAKDLKGIADNITNIKNNNVKDLSDKLGTLKNELNDVKIMSTGLKDEAEKILDQFTKSDAYIKVELAKVMQERTKLFSKRIVGWLDQGTKHLIDLAKNELLKCKPVANLYDGLVNTYACDNIMQNLNGFWLALGWCLLFFVPCIILSVKLAKFFRKMKYEAGFDKADYPPHNNSYPRNSIQMVEREHSINRDPHNRVYPQSARAEPTDRTSLMSSPISPHGGPGPAPPPYSNPGYEGYRHQ